MARNYSSRKFPRGDIPQSMIELAVRKYFSVQPREDWIPSGATYQARAEFRRLEMELQRYLPKTRKR
ncbi:MAG: hypothetical protein WCK90_02050 [archaeon]